ncbi:MAG: hypothetical protein IT373_21230 [Polyangiaceae bacterium]|nr:hypothetical protein [Polyangiaceae bacterium]
MAALLGAGLVLSTASAFAQGVDIEDKGTGDVVYKFGDDPLSALGRDTNLAVLKVRNHTVRKTLIRPRVSFVREMLKSVESI